MAGITASLQCYAGPERSAFGLRSVSPHFFGFLMEPEGRQIRGSGGGLRRADCTLRICWSCCPAPPSSLLPPSLWPLRLDQRLPCFLRPEAEAHRTARSSCGSGGQAAGRRRYLCSSKGVARAHWALTLASPDPPVTAAAMAQWLTA